MNKETIKYKNIISVISIILLLLAIFDENDFRPDLPYGYYIFLKWVVTIGAVLSTWVAYHSKKTFWLISMAMVAILFNPFVPIRLGEEMRIIINFIITILFLISIFKIKFPKLLNKTVKKST